MKPSLNCLAHTALTFQNMSSSHRSSWGELPCEDPRTPGEGSTLLSALVSSVPGCKLGGLVERVPTEPPPLHLGFGGWGKCGRARDEVLKVHGK